MSGEKQTDGPEYDQWFNSGDLLPEQWDRLAIMPSAVRDEIERLSRDSCLRIRRGGICIEGCCAECFNSAEEKIRSPGP